MAVKDCEELSNIISLGILSGDDDLAKTIADLSAKKKDALMRAGKLKEGEVDDLTGRSAHELELRANSADIEMRAIVQAKILSDEIRVGDAYRELAFQIRETGGTIAGGVDLLEKLRNASPADFESIAKQWGGKYANEPAKAIEEMRNAIAETVSANYSIRQYSDIKSKGLNSLRKQLRNGEITQGVFDDEVKKLHKDAMEQIAKGESPKDFAKLDSEWAAIKKIYGDNPVAAGKAWSQFIMARELLSDGGIDDGVLKAFEEMGAENLTGDLTLDQIAKYGKGDLDKLLARAYTNTEQLYRDGELRQAFREKLEELTAGMRVSADDIKKANSIMKTMQFAQQGATFSDVITADNAVRSARKRGYKVSDGTAFLNSLKAFAKKMDEDAKLLDKPIVINGVEMKPLDVIQIIYDITGDENILKLLRIGFYNDGTVLSVATSRLLGGNKEAASKILRLFAKAGEQPRVTNVRDISLKAISGSDIKEGAKVGFFDFRKSLYSKDELNRARADFMDKLAERNKMRVSSEGLEIINSEPVTAEILAEELKEKIKGGYLLVNDNRWRDNDILSKALDIANEGVKEEEKITVLFPRGGMDANFSVENGQLFYKTTKDDMFRDVAGTISIQSMGEARPTREILATAYEAKTGKNGDKVRYQPSYSKGAVDSEGRQISDQQYEYFSNSVVRDENGNLIPVYHGAWDKSITVLDSRLNKYGRFGINNAIFFSDNRSVAKGYNSDAVIECYINLTNPFIIDNKGEWWNKINVSNIIKEEYNKNWNNKYSLFKLYRKKYEDDKLLDHIDEINDELSFFNYRLEKGNNSFVNIIDLHPGDAQGAVKEYSLETVHELLYGEVAETIRRSGDLSFTTDDMVKYIMLKKELGEVDYDGVIIKNVKDNASYLTDAGPENDYIIFNSDQAKYVDNRLPTSNLNIDFMKRVKDYASQSDINAEDAVKVQMFTKDRTWQQIADAYGFPVKIVQGDMIEGVAAYGAWGNGMIYFTDMVKESTAPHELFHAIFNTYVGKEQYDRVLEDASKLFQVSKYDAEEILADSFAEWFNTGKFTYGDKIKAIGGKKKLSKQQKTFLQKVKDYFTDLAETLGLVDRHRDEVEKMFNDMVNMQYLPDAGKNIDAQRAMMKYNDELNDVAVKYFGEMLGLSSREVDSQYVERVQKLLSEKIGIDLKSFDQLQDKAALWQRIDKQFSLDRLTAGKYDKEIVDINAIKNEISNLTNEELEESIKRELGDIVARSDIKGNENIAHIREAYLDYKTAGSAVDSLMAKGKIVSLANGGTAQTMSMNDIKTMFQNGTFEKAYKEMFFPNQELSKKEMDSMIAKINNDMFDTLSISFAENLVSAGYELPLINIKSLVYDYLNGKLDLNNKFVESFLYKNNIPFSQDGLRTLVDTLMPAEFKFNYEDSLFKGRLDKLELPSEASVFREVDNRFMQDSYSALASIQMARAGDMPINYEEQILTDILDKYVSEVFKGVKDKSLTFQKAQQLKQEAGYALDMFEQDFLLPRYSKFVSKQEMNGIMGMKYALPIGVAGQNPDKVNQELLSIRNKLLQKYKMTLKNAANNNDINMAIVKGTADKKLEKEIELRRDKLAESGGVIREVNGQYLVYDVKQALEEVLNNLPDTIGGIEGLRVLGRDGIDRLSNKQAYAILRYVEAAKGLSTKLNYPTELMYKQNPMLLKYNFFEAYKVVDGLPRVLNGNLLNGDKVLSALDNTAELDIAAKKNIFAGVISKFREQGYVTTEDLNKIVRNGVSEAQATFKQIKLSPKQIKQATEKMETLYRKAFLPYTYLRDIPKGGQLLDGTPVKNMKKKVEDTIKLQYKQAMDDLKAIGVDNADELQTSIYITLDSGERVSVKEAGDMNMDSWKKSIFNDESVFVAGADEIKSFAVDPTGDKQALDKVVAQQKEYRESIINSYDSTLQSMLNQTQIISEAEADLSTAFMNDVRTAMRRYSLTNMMVDAMDALSGLNEEAARGMKDYLIGWKGRISFGKWKPGQILERNKLVQTAYQNYYVMDLSKLNSITPTSQAEDLALRLAKYFKNLERLLGSADGLTGCTTNKEINQAFFHLGEVVMNVNSVKGIFGLMSAVEQNQILKFFKFANISNSNPASIFVRRGKGNFQESLGGYRDYVEEISGISRGEFNEIFGADFSEEDFKRILQGLTGFTLTGAWGRTGTKILNVLNGSNMIFRMMMSYPGQLLTIPQQGTAYFLKQIGFEKELGVESLSEIDAIRTHYGVLDGAYNEIVLRGKSTVSPDDLRLDSYYNRYGIPDVDGVYKASPIETSDDYINMYAKIDKEAASSISSTNKWFRQLDPYKDNANNIIDGLFARNFKNISFLKAIKNNDFMQFGSAKEFMSFMDDATISADIKTRLMDRVSAYSGRNFRNILGLGFGGIDRAVSGSGFGNIMYGLMQLFNFRGSWGQNIFKQTGSNIFTALKMLGTANGIWSREGREAIAQYIATRPEFTNFVGALFNDLKWTWKLQRFQDNGRWPEDEDMYSMLDFIDYMTETLNMTSQWFQGLQSFGPFRPFDEARQSIMASAMNPTIYKDTFGVGAFFNALGKNFGRQWKPYNWIAKLAGAWTTDGPDGAWAYIENEWWKLSFGSLRYMVNEDMNSYGYTYEMTGQVGGIPSIIMGESKLGSDKNFSYEIDNTETWETIKQMFDSGLPWDTRWTYAGNLAKTFINGSQLAALPKNVMKAINRNAPSYFTANDLADTMQNTRAGLEFYKKGIVTPQTPEEAEIFFNTMLENAKYRPGSSNFTKSLIQYEDYGHMNGKEKGNEADAEMELWLDHMKHITNEHGEIQMNGSEKVVDPSWDRLIEDVKAHGYNETYTTDLIYNYAKSWLNNHSSDPNYQLYVKMLGQGQAYNLISTRESQLIEALNAGVKGKDNKWTKTEFENVGLDKALLLKMGQQPLEGENISFFDKLQVLDEDDATVAALQIIQSQAKEGDRKIMDRFFNVKENDDGSKSVSLKYNYEQTLKQIGAVSKAINDGNVDLAVAEASILTNMYKNDDPTGAITATLIDSVYNRIYDTDSFSPEQKQAAMIALFHKNKEFIQRNPEKLRALLGDDYDVYADYMNSMLYQWDGMTISNLESMQSSGKSSSGSGKAAASFSSALKNLASKLGGSGKSNGGAGGTTSYKQWVPVTIKGASLVKDLGLKGYTPTVNKISISKYKPHLDLSLAKDINRNVKTTKTQTISDKKQLSKLEQKATKAIEAES